MTGDMRGGRRALAVGWRALLVTLACFAAVKFFDQSEGRVGDLRAGGATTRPATMPTFVFSADEPGEHLYLRELRREFGIDAVVAGAGDDLDRLQRLCTWVHQQWEHDGGTTPERPDPVSILRAARRGERFRCVEYATVLAGVCQSVGLPARSVGLMTADVETRASGAGHVVAEVFLPDRGAWVMADAQWDAIPVRGSAPLSVVELEDAMGHAAPGELSTYRKPRASADRYFRWVRPYLFYVKVPFDARVRPTDRRHVILVPPGSREPRVFQRTGGIGAAVYTSFPADLYPAIVPAASATRPTGR